MSETLLERCAFLAVSAAGNPTHYMIEQALGQAELDWRFLTFEVDDDHLARALDGLDVLGFRGVMLAAEFRTATLEHVNKLSARAERAGAANCLVRQDGTLVGDDTYGPAFVQSLGGASRLEGTGVLLIGNGRVARTLAAACCEAKAARVYLADDDTDNVTSLIEALACDTTEMQSLEVDDEAVRAPADVSIVVFAPDDEDQVTRPAIDTTEVGGKLTIVDTRLRGSRTGLVRSASEQGATIIDGVELFARETALALELWTGISFDPAPLQELAEEFLGV